MANAFRFISAYSLAVFVGFLLAVATGSASVPQRKLGAETSEKTQKFDSVEVTQIVNSACFGMRIRYLGKVNSQQKLQAYVNLNGANGIFEMERVDDEHRLVLTSCPVSCQEDRQVQRPCTDQPVDMRKLFYWAGQTGKPTPWFVELAFLANQSNARDPRHDSFDFYFP